MDDSLHMHDLGLSAFNRSNIERGALGGFLDAIEQGRIEKGSYLLVESLDRLSRDKVLAALELFISILRRGITIVTLADRMVYSTESVGNNFGNLIISITIMARAHEESIMKSHRVSAAWAGKRAKINEKKLTAQCPRWLRLSQDKSHFEIIPERAELVREILSWHKMGMGQAQIAKRLNERGEPQFSNHGSGWHSSYIQKITNNTALYGEFQPHLWNRGALEQHGEPVADYYPALITKDEFNLLKHLRSERKQPGARARKGKDVPNLFSGLVKCGYCGSTMVLAGGAAQRVRSEDGTKVTRPGKKVLVCDGARRGLGCYAVQWEYEAFEKSFLSFCKSVDLNNLIAEPRHHNDQHKQGLTLTQQMHALSAAIETCDDRLEKLLAVLELGDAPAAVVARIRKIESEREELETTRKKVQEQISSLSNRVRNQADQAESIQYAINFLESLEGDERFKLRSLLAERIRHVIARIDVYPAGQLMSSEKKKQLREELLASGFEVDRVNAYVDTHYRTEPLRTGRGARGRYASRKDIRRNFIIRAKSGALRVAFPNYDDPFKVVVELGDA
ncbi:DNA invertase Pin-like site-specific DNA recombinase [Massilia sp. UYP32]